MSIWGHNSQSLTNEISTIQDSLIGRPYYKVAWSLIPEKKTIEVRKASVKIHVKSV